MSPKKQNTTVARLCFRFHSKVKRGNKKLIGRLVRRRLNRDLALSF